MLFTRPSLFAIYQIKRYMVVNKTNNQTFIYIEKSLCRRRIHAGFGGDS